MAKNKDDQVPAPELEEHKLLFLWPPGNYRGKILWAEKSATKASGVPCVKIQIECRGQKLFGYLNRIDYSRMWLSFHPDQEPTTELVEDVNWLAGLEVDYSVRIHSSSSDNGDLFASPTDITLAT